MHLAMDEPQKTELAQSGALLCQISALIGNFSVNKFASIKTSVIYTTLYCLQSVQTLKYFKTLKKSISARSTIPCPIFSLAIQ